VWRNPLHGEARHRALLRNWRDGALGAREVRNTHTGYWIAQHIADTALRDANAAILIRRVVVLAGLEDCAHLLPIARRCGDGDAEQEYDTHRGSRCQADALHHHENQRKRGSHSHHCAAGAREREHGGNPQQHDGRGSLAELPGVVAQHQGQRQAHQHQHSDVVCIKHQRAAVESSEAVVRRLQVEHRERQDDDNADTNHEGPDEHCQVAHIANGSDHQEIENQDLAVLVEDIAQRSAHTEAHRRGHERHDQKRDDSHRGPRVANIRPTDQLRTKEHRRDRRREQSKRRPSVLERAEVHMHGAHTDDEHSRQSDTHDVETLPPLRQ